jgi:lysozyme family protein
MKWLIKLIRSLFKSKDKAIALDTPIKLPEIGTIEIPEIPGSDIILAGITINERSVSELASVCNAIEINKERYLSAQRLTGVPWDVIAACHYRESSLSFKGVLHNGEYIIGTGKKTKLVPAGRGPFGSWEAAAVDAMMIESSKFPKVWDTAGKLDFTERYNGLGYRKKGVPSPYVYAGTNKYSSGLYVADGKYSSTKVDLRLGTAAIIKGLAS